MTTITYDPAKDATNRLKHGVSLALANELEWDSLECKTDTRRNYGEPRQIGYAIAGDRLYFVWFSSTALAMPPLSNESSV